MSLIKHKVIKTGKYVATYKRDSQIKLMDSSILNLIKYKDPKTPLASILTNNDEFETLVFDSQRCSSLHDVMTYATKEEALIGHSQICLKWELGFQ
jgi:hypothetical protein